MNELTLLSPFTTRVIGYLRFAGWTNKYDHISELNSSPSIAPSRCLVRRASASMDEGVGKDGGASRNGDLTWKDGDSTWEIGDLTSKTYFETCDLTGEIAI